MRGKPNVAPKLWITSPIGLVLLLLPACSAIIPGQPPGSGGRDAGPRDACATNVELCNLADDDCDGTVDEGADCGGCTPREVGTLVYCDDGAATWAQASNWCTSRGWSLVSVANAAELSAILAEASASVWTCYSYDNVPAMGRCYRCGEDRTCVTFDPSLPPLDAAPAAGSCVATDPAMVSGDWLVGSCTSPTRGWVCAR